MWAGSILLRIGAERDLLVAVAVDTADALQQLRTLFEPWLEPDRLLVAEVEPALSVVIGSAAGSRSGPRSVPQLRLGSQVMMRSRQPDDVLVAVARVLGGVHAHRRDDGLTWMGLRPFVLEGQVVLVDAERPALVNDPTLARIGVHELPVWSVVAESDGSVRVPPALPGLAWEAVGIRPPSAEWSRFHLAGIAVLQRQGCSQAELVAALAMRSTGAEWFATLKGLAERAVVMAYAERPGIRNFIAQVLDVPPSEARDRLRS